MRGAVARALVVLGLCSSLPILPPHPRRPRVCTQLVCVCVCPRAACLALTAAAYADEEAQFFRDATPSICASETACDGVYLNSNNRTWRMFVASLLVLSLPFF